MAERLRRPRGADRAAKSSNPFLTTLVTCWTGGIEQTFLPVAQHPPARARAIVKIPLEKGAAAVIISKFSTPRAADPVRGRGNRRPFASYRCVRGSVGAARKVSLLASHGRATVWLRSARSHASRSEALLSGSTGAARTRHKGVDVSLTVSSAPRSGSNVTMSLKRARLIPPKTRRAAAGGRCKVFELRCCKPQQRG